MKTILRIIGNLVTVALIGMVSQPNLFGSTIFNTESKLLGQEATIAAHHGRAVATDGNTLAVGSAGVDNLGAVYIYTLENDQWVLQQRLAVNDVIRGGGFGNSLDISGDTLVVGAYGDDEVGFNIGKVYIFERANGIWTQSQKILPNPSAYFFGMSVAVEGEVLAIGSALDRGVVHNGGAVYIYRRQAGPWSEVQKLVPSDTSVWAGFGDSVALSGTSLLVGAPSDHIDGAEGSPYIFQRIGGVWLEQQKFRDPQPGFGFAFGDSIALEGDLAMIGGFAGERAFGLHRTASGWVQQRINPPDGDGTRRFGFSVALSGNTAIMGAPYDNSQTGSAYLFSFNGANWTFEEKLTGSDSLAGDLYGWAVGLRGDSALVGSIAHSANAARSGAIYVYSYEAPQPPTISDLVAAVESLRTAGVMNAGQANSLLTKLRNAQRAVEAGNGIAAAPDLRAFINEVRALMASGRLASDVGQSLIDRANAVLSQL